MIVACPGREGSDSEPRPSSSSRRIWSGRRSAAAWWPRTPRAPRRSGADAPGAGSGRPETAPGGCPGAARAPARRGRRNHGIALAPDDQRRHRRGEIEAIGGAHVLPAGVDYRAGRANEGLPGVHPPARRSRGRTPRRPGPPTARFGAGTGQPLRRRREAAPSRAAAARTPLPAAWPIAAPGAPRGLGRRSDEDEALAVLGKLVGELHRDSAAERMPDERGPRYRAPPAGRGCRTLRAQRIVAARLGGFAVAEHIRGRSRCDPGRAGIASVQVCELPAMPWMRTITGPRPRPTVGQLVSVE